MCTTVKELIKDLNAHGGNLSGVYKITRISDGKVYIGQSENIAQRIEQHINNIHENDSEKIDGAIQKDGWQNFTYEIELALPELNTEQLWLAESTYIAKYDSYNKGFNKTQGNHIGKYDHAEFVRKNVVSAELTKKLRDHFKLDFYKRKVLLINLFDEQFINVLKYRDSEVTMISKYFEDKKDLGEYIMNELDKLQGTHFDLIIANPPYGKTGANITKKIINTIDYDEFVNLLPANDYIRNDDKDLFKYADISTMTSVRNGFSDAAVTTHAARINKKPCHYVSWDEFQIENYTDESLIKYFYANRQRKHATIDSVELSGATDKQFKQFDVNTTVLFGNRDVNHKHLPYDKQCDTYKYNVEKSVDNNYIFNNRKATRGGVYDGWLHVAGITFVSAKEKDNFVSFIYSKDGFRFLSKVFTSVNIDGTINCGKVFPKVDWTRAWTVEEILADYGYTPDEIKEVMDDLVNFKGMED